MDMSFRWVTRFCHTTTARLPWQGFTTAPAPILVQLPHLALASTSRGCCSRAGLLRSSCAVSRCWGTV